MEKKFNPGQRVLLAVNPNEIVTIGTSTVFLFPPHPKKMYEFYDTLSQLKQNQVYHAGEYCGNFHGEPMITLRETGDTQYLEKLFKPAKRERLKAARIRPNPYFSR
jgi:hypothetical protein